VLLVVFGAGASFDSVPHLRPTEVLPAVRPAMQNDHFENDRLPLANQLFDTRPMFVQAMQQFPDCLAVIPQLRKEGVIVEAELATIRAQARTYSRAHRELAAIIFYIHFAIWECQKRWNARHRGITNYATLVRELERWRTESNEDVWFVSFNYDTMLEAAMEQVLSSTFNEFDRYISHNHYSLVKLHGSINWGREVESIRAVSPEQLIAASSPNLVITNRFRLVEQHPMRLVGGGIGFPALSIPVQNKDEFSCPQEHVAALGNILTDVTKVIAIGWRATEADFLAMLSARITGLHGKPQLFVVSGDQKGADETKANLTKAFPAFENYPPATDGFSGLISNPDRLSEFLRAS